MSVSKSVAGFTSRLSSGREPSEIELEAGFQAYPAADSIRLEHDLAILPSGRISGSSQPMQAPTGDQPQRAVINGTSGGDHLTGTTGDDTIYGFGGTDRLDGWYGDDTVYGGDGNDVLVAHTHYFEMPSFDRLFGEEGDDLFQVGFHQANAFLIDGGTGIDRLDLRLFSGSGVTQFVWDWSETTDGVYRIGQSSITSVERGDIGLGDGADVVNIGEANFRLYGFEGNDTIVGGSLNNTLSGGNGDDVLRGEGGVDYLYGGAGTDRLYGGANGDYFYADRALVGDVVLSPQWADDFIYGGGSQDYLVYPGFSSEYEVRHFDGYSTVRHIASNTTDTTFQVERVVFADIGLNLTVGLFTALSDEIRFDEIDPAEFPSQYASGGQLRALDGDDVVYFPSTASGYASHQLTGATFEAGGGNDIVWGGLLADKLNGDAGNDTLRGGGGNDELRGGVGNDLLEGGEGADYLEGGDGIDTATYARASAAVSIDLNLNSATGSATGSDSLLSIENAIGSDFADTIVGSILANRLEGGRGADRIEGGAGADVILGGDGADRLYDGTSTDSDGVADTLTGGAGRDTFHVGSGDTVTDFSVDDAGVIVMGETAGRIIIIGAGASREVRAYDADFLAYDVVNLTNMPVGKKLVVKSDPLGARIEYAQQIGSSVFDRASTDPDAARAAVKSRVIEHDQTMKSFFSSGSNLTTGYSAPLGDEQAIGPVFFAIAVGAILGWHGRDIHDAIKQKAASTGSSYFGVVAGLLGVDFNGFSAQWRLFNYNQDYTSPDYDAEAEAAGFLFDPDYQWQLAPGEDPLAAASLLAVSGADAILHATDRVFDAIEAEMALRAAKANADLNAALNGQDQQRGDTSLSEFLFTTLGRLGYSGGGGGDTFLGSILSTFNAPGGASMAALASQGQQTFDGGSGIDEMSYAVETAAVTVDLVQGRATGAGIGTDILINIENVSGGQAADTLRGDAGANVLAGGSGDDVLEGRGENDTLIGGEGLDRAVFSGNRSQYVITQIEPGRFSVAGPDGTDLLVGVEFAQFADQLVQLEVQTLNGTSLGEVIVGSELAEVINGLGGNDSLSGRGGDDVLNGGDGGDVLNGGAGADTIDGGDGLDTADYVDSDAAVSVNLSSGAATGGHAQGDSLNSIENLTGSNFDDDLRGDANANILTGGTGNDILNGGAGDDLLTGGLGADTLIGGSGIDTASYADATSKVKVWLNLGQVGAWASGDTLSGIENLIGSAYDDVLAGDNLNNVLQGGGGADELKGGLGDDQLVGASGDDILDGAEGNDTLVGGDNRDTLKGGDGDDSLNGGNGNDKLNAGSGADNLQGGSGDDKLAGGSDNDVIEGGTGNDRLTGGSGDDLFVFRGASGVDVITDFKAGAGVRDVISFQTSLFTSLADVKAHTVNDGLGNCVISKNGVVITLMGVTRGDLVADDFVFVASAPDTESKDFSDPLTLPPLDDMDPLVLPVGLETKVTPDDLPLVLPGDDGLPLTRPEIDLAELGLSDFGGRDPHRFMAEARAFDWIV